MYVLIRSFVRRTGVWKMGRPTLTVGHIEKVTRNKVPPVLSQQRVTICLVRGETSAGPASGGSGAGGHVLLLRRSRAGGGSCMGLECLVCRRKQRKGGSKGAEKGGAGGEAEEEEKEREEEEEEEAEAKSSRLPGGRTSTGYIQVRTEVVVHMDDDDCAISGLICG